MMAGGRVSAGSAEREARRRHAPAAARNREPILDVLRRVLPGCGTVLEVASGTGEHAVYFAPRLAPRFWLPTDVDGEALDSIAAWREAAPAPTLLPPMRLDVTARHWPTDWLPAPISAIVAINLLHIAPWAACLGLLTGAARLLPEHGVLYLYGPFRQGDAPLAPGNVAFDASLRGRNPEWGLRDLNEVARAAHALGLGWVGVAGMPANNRSVILARGPVIGWNEPPHG